MYRVDVLTGEILCDTAEEALELSRRIVHSLTEIASAISPKPDQKPKGHLEFCEICQEDADHDHLKEHALGMLRKGHGPKYIASVLKISAGRIQAWQQRAGIQLRRSPIVSGAQARGKGRPSIPEPQLQAVADEVSSGKTISQSASDNGIHRNTASRFLSNQREMAPCGKCHYRKLDGNKFLASQPDCPEHGTGLGVPQERRDRGPETI